MAYARKEGYGMEIKSVMDPAFRRYGKVLTGYDFSELVKVMKDTPIPDDVVYVPSVSELEEQGVYKELQEKGFGGMPIQIGYCNGHNKLLNALEYHRNSEINVAATDLILLIGAQQDMESDYTYDVCHVEAFFCTGGNGHRSVCYDIALCALPYKRKWISVCCRSSKRNEYRSGF